MKAVRFHNYGASTELVLEEVPVPQAGPGQVLVKVIATSFNPVDAFVRAGFLREFLPLDLPRVPGLDVSGTIEAVGPGVTGWAPGQTVAATLPLHNDGASAEFVLAPAKSLAAVPDNVDAVDVAALPVPCLTAWQALSDHGHLLAGQRVLINGAGGAVGGYAVQLAHLAGAHVTATASQRSSARVLSYGADEVVDYTSTPLTEGARGPFDLVINVAQATPQDLERLIALTADGGRFVSTTTAPSDAPDRGVKVVQMTLHSDGTQLATLLSRVARGEIVIDVAARQPLADLAAVHAEAEQGTLPGKTVITV